MSYLVLARKYRPANFAQLVGQEHVVQALSNALKSGRLHHAYLFTGTRGVGKTTVSRILAKSLNCQGEDGTGGITDNPCGVCAACRDIDAGRFVDYTELDAASNRGVDEVQSLLEQAVYRPVQGRFKVFMIDEVHMLTGHAFNAMLKTLEEPPEHLKFVLATTDPQKVPVTVLSRCLQFNLRPMAPETVQSHLAQVLASENIAAERAALMLIARAARGSMRDALSLTDQAIAFSAGALEEAAVRQMLGSVDRGHVVRLVDALARGDGRAVLDVVAALRTHGLSAAATLEDMSDLLHRMAVRQAVPSSSSTADEAGDDADDAETAQIARLALMMPADETQLLYSICVHGRAELALAPDEYAGLTMVLLRLLAFKPTAGAAAAGPPRALAPNERAEAQDAQRQQAAPASDAARLRDAGLQRSGSAGGAQAAAPGAAAQPQQRDRSSAHEARIAAAPYVAAAAAASPASDTAPLRQPAIDSTSSHDRIGDLSTSLKPPIGSTLPQPQPGEGIAAGDDGDFWHATVQRLIAADAVGALVRELALQSQLVARDGGCWRLRVESASLNQPAVRERLAQALSAAAGHDVRLDVEAGPVADSPARRNAAAAGAALRDAEQRIANDPFVQTMMREFGARIVPGSVKPLPPVAGGRHDAALLMDNPALNPR